MKERGRDRCRWIDAREIRALMGVASERMGLAGPPFEARLLA
jgi:hypothetical protein